MMIEKNSDLYYHQERDEILYSLGTFVWGSMKRGITWI